MGSISAFAQTDKVKCRLLNGNEERTLLVEVSTEEKASLKSSETVFLDKNGSRSLVSISVSANDTFDKSPFNEPKYTVWMFLINENPFDINYNYSSRATLKVNFPMSATLTGGVSHVTDPGQTDSLSISIVCD